MNIIFLNHVSENDRYSTEPSYSNSKMTHSEKKRVTHQHFLRGIRNAINSKINP